jgi:hypothetical protein
MNPPFLFKSNSSFNPHITTSNIFQTKKPSKMHVLTPFLSLLVLVGPTLTLAKDLVPINTKNERIREGEMCSFPGQQRCMGKYHPFLYIPIPLKTDYFPDPRTFNVAYEFQTGVYGGPGWIQTCGDNLNWWQATTRSGVRKNVGCKNLRRIHGPGDSSEGLIEKSAGSGG